MRGLAKYVENNPGVYRRVEVCAEINGKFLTVDLSDAKIRKMVNEASEIADVYKSKLLSEYS
jgi:hypothetical protein